MKVKYVGPSAEGVTINETGEHVGQNETIEVPDDLGKRLIEQAVWEKPGAAKKKAGDK